MAIIAVAATNLLPFPQAWELPPGPVALRSPIPRGLVTFAGIDAIAALVGGNQTNYGLKLTMPPGFAYLPRTILIRYSSDDTDISYDAEGLAFLTVANAGGSDIGEPGAISHGLTSPGVFTRAAVSGSRIWTPSDGSPKIMLQGGDTFEALLTDMDVAADGATAGDMSYWCQYYVFDVDQIDKWEVNSPIPVISHVSF